MCVNLQIKQGFTNKTTLLFLNYLTLPYLTLTYLTIINISMNKFNKVFCLRKFLSHFIIINFSMMHATIVLIKYELILHNKTYMQLQPYFK